jgi:hypothetical protein
MTRPLKKTRERFLVEETAKRLGKAWDLGPDREHPDFFVKEGAQQFGLEVSEIFMGPQSRAGSAMKEVDSNTQRAVEALRHEYEAIANTPLTVKFVGDMCAENIAAVVRALIGEDLPSKPVGHRVIIDEGRGLRVHVTKAFRPDWYSVNHRVGWVDRFPIKRIAEAIEKKAKELPRYREAVGANIRLLIMADRIHNSGKFMLEETTALDLRGFQAVYFFPYPETVIVFD